MENKVDIVHNIRVHLCTNSKNRDIAIGTAPVRNILLIHTYSCILYMTKLLSHCVYRPTIIIGLLYTYIKMTNDLAPSQGCLSIDSGL